MKFYLTIFNGFEHLSILYAYNWDHMSHVIWLISFLDHSWFQKFHSAQSDIEDLYGQGSSHGLHYKNGAIFEDGASEDGGLDGRLGNDFQNEVPSFPTIERQVPSSSISDPDSYYLVFDMYLTKISRRDIKCNPNVQCINQQACVWTWWYSQSLSKLLSNELKYQKTSLCLLKMTFLTSFYWSFLSLIWSA